MAQLKARGYPGGLPAMAIEGQGSYREAMVKTWRVPGIRFPEERVMREASCVGEDWVYNLTRPTKTLRIEVHDGQRRW